MIFSHSDHPAHLRCGTCASWPDFAHEILAQVGELMTQVNDNAAAIAALVATINTNNATEVAANARIEAALADASTPLDLTDLTSAVGGQTTAVTATDAIVPLPATPPSTEPAPSA